MKPRGAELKALASAYGVVNFAPDFVPVCAGQLWQTVNTGTLGALDLEVQPAFRDSSAAAPRPKTPICTAPRLGSFR
jgi:hypothetical protein